MVLLYSSVCRATLFDLTVEWTFVVLFQCPLFEVKASVQSIHAVQYSQHDGSRPTDSFAPVATSKGLVFSRTR